MTFRGPLIKPQNKPQTRATPDASQSTNLELFKNPIPTVPIDYSDGAWRVPQGKRDLSQPTNPNLYPGVVASFTLMGQVWC